MRYLDNLNEIYVDIFRSLTMSLSETHFNHDFC